MLGAIFETKERIQMTDTRTNRLIALVLILALPVPFTAPATAQDATQPITCDATLVTLMLVAVQDYGYEPPIRFDLFNYAQYRPLAEAISGQALPEPQATLSPSAGEQAREALQDAAADLEARGLGAIGEGLAGISDELASVVDAGAAALQQGQAAIEAGAAALQNRDDGTLLTYGTVPGQSEYCDFLRVDLIDFMWQRLREQQGIE
jgi:hypothetical protein